MSVGRYSEQLRNTQTDLPLRSQPMVVVVAGTGFAGTPLTTYTSITGATVLSSTGQVTTDPGGQLAFFAGQSFDIYYPNGTLFQAGLTPSPDPSLVGSGSGSSSFTDAGQWQPNGNYALSTRYLDPYGATRLVKANYTPGSTFGATDIANTIVLDAGTWAGTNATMVAAAGLVAAGNVCFASDVNGGTPYRNDGAGNWTKIAAGAAEASGTRLGSAYLATSQTGFNSTAATAVLTCNATVGARPLVAVMDLALFELSWAAAHQGVLGLWDTTGTATLLWQWGLQGSGVSGAPEYAIHVEADLTPLALAQGARTFQMRLNVASGDSCNIGGLGDKYYTGMRIVQE